MDVKKLLSHLHDPLLSVEEPGAVGGFKEARKRHLAKLSKACAEDNIREVQRLALYTLSWWNGTRQPLTLDDLNELRKRCGFEEPT